MKLDLPSSFGLFHALFHALNAHIDDLKSVLARLNFNFDIIGISEHKILKDTSPSNNINISGYKEFTYEPTETDFGGTEFYIKEILIKEKIFKLILLKIMSLCLLKLYFQLKRT